MRLNKETAFNAFQSTAAHKAYSLESEQTDGNKIEEGQEDKVAGVSTCLRVENTTGRADASLLTHRSER